MREPQIICMYFACFMHQLTYALAFFNVVVHIGIVTLVAAL